MRQEFKSGPDFAFSAKTQPHVVIMKAFAKVFDSSNLLFNRQTVSYCCYLELVVPFLRGWWLEGSLKPMAIMVPSVGYLSTLLPQRKGTVVMKEPFYSRAQLTRLLRETKSR